VNAVLKPEAMGIASVRGLTRQQQVVFGDANSLQGLEPWNMEAEEYMTLGVLPGVNW
jgi:hypothetical protein